MESIRDFASADSCAFTVILHHWVRWEQQSVPFGLGGCYISEHTKLLTHIWISPLFVESALVGVMVFKGCLLWREKRWSPVLELIVFDSFIYYGSIFMALLINAVIWLTQVSEYWFVAIPWMEAIPSIMACRLLLNIRARYYKEKELSQISAGEIIIAVPSLDSETFEMRQRQYFELSS